jgi:hypothetical protein
MYVRRNQAGSPFYTLGYIGILVVNNLPSRQMGVLVGLAQRIDFCAATNLMGSNWKTTTLYGTTLFYDYKENFLTERISTSNHLLFRETALKSIGIQLFYQAVHLTPFTTAAPSTT